MRIAKRKIYRHYNLRQKLGFGKIHYEQMEEIEEELTDFEDFTVEDTLVTKETLELVHKILEKQDILTRKVFYLRFYTEVSFKEIAKILEIPEGTVKTRLYRTLKSIKRELEEGVDDL